MRIADSADGLRLLRTICCTTDRLAEHTSADIEWAWIVGRVAVIGVVGLAVATANVNHEAARVLLTASAFVFAYSVVLAVMLRAGMLTPVFLLGVALDTATMFATWWAADMAFRGAMVTDDLYLVELPLVAVNAVRFPARLTIAYLALMMVWLAWTSVTFFGPGSNDVVQLPVRIPLISITMLLFIYFVHERRRETAARREVAHRLQELRVEAERERQEVRSTMRSLEVRLLRMSLALRRNAEQARIVLANSGSASDVRLGFTYFVGVVERIAANYAQKSQRSPMDPPEGGSGRNGR